MQNFMKTIINAVQTWTSGKIQQSKTELDNRIKDSVADWNQNDSSADSYIKNKPDVVIADEFDGFADEVGTVLGGMQTDIETAQTTADGKMDATNPVGTGSFSMNRKSGTTVGTNSHAEGSYTTASGTNSHAEGSYTTASGNHSHAEGGNTTAAGFYSHAEGRNTYAASEHQHAQGKYNIQDTGNKYAHIVGNGSSKARSNAHTLDWDGNAWYAGDVYVGCTSGTNKDEGSKKLATEEYTDTKITAPTTAEVGQTIVVKAVDENGKPTEWEAVDMPDSISIGVDLGIIAPAADENNAILTDVNGAIYTL